MTKQKHFIMFAVFFVLSLFLVSGVRAESNFVFPVPELGNCENKEACREYCDLGDHAKECAQYGQKIGTLDQETSEKLKESLFQGGPGGCRNAKECRAHCEFAVNAGECGRFGEEHNLIRPEQVKELKDFSELTGPGGCRGATQCREYCAESSHQEECIQFGNRRGLISDNEARVARQVSGQGGPGGCRNPNDCRLYCEDQAHVDECLVFGEKNGIVSSEDAVRLRKIGLIAGPGGCKGDQCRTYCEDLAHHEECFQFAEKNGLMSKSELERARKLGGKPGPGGCRADACRAYCEDSAHIEECTQFALDNGFISKDEAERARKFKKTFEDEEGPGGCRGDTCRQYCGDQSHQAECFKFAKQKGFIRPEEEKKFEAGNKIREKMLTTGGPGGCKNEEECRNYCTDSSRVEECIAFGAAHGGIPEEEVRKMLKEFQESKFEHGFGGGVEFGHPGEFRRFEEEANQRFEEFRVLEENFRGGQFPGGGFPPPFAGGDFPGQGRGGFSGEGEQGGGGFVGGPGFVGPGGCTSPNECIKYCSEHKDECFDRGNQGQGQNRDQGDHGQQGQGGRGGGECCPAPGGFSVHFRQDSIQQVQGQVFGEIERCVAEAFGGEEQKDQALRENSGAFFERKNTALRSCTEKLKTMNPQGGSRDGQAGFDPKEFEKFERFMKPINENQGGGFGGMEQMNQTRPEEFRGGGEGSGTQGGSRPPFPGRGPGPFPGQGNMQGKPFEGGDGFRPQGQPFEGGGFQPGGFPQGQEGFIKPEGEFHPSGFDGFENREQTQPTSGSFSQPQGGSFGQPPPPSGDSFHNETAPSGGFFQPIQPPPSSGESFQSAPPPSGDSGGSQPPPPQSQGATRRFFANMVELLF